GHGSELSIGAVQVVHLRRAPPRESMSTDIARHFARSSFMALGCWAAACGSRTPLGEDADLFFHPGAHEACATDCGPGKRTCLEGRGRACDGRIVGRPCADEC